MKFINKRNIFILFLKVMVICLFIFKGNNEVQRLNYIKENKKINIVKESTSDVVGVLLDINLTNKMVNIFSNSILAF